MKGGLILEPPRFKNFSMELVFGAAPFMEKIERLNRDISGLPIVYQGNRNTCVSCALTWYRQWIDKKKPDLSWEWLAEISRTGEKGATPSQVLEPARKTGIAPDTYWKTKDTRPFEEVILQAAEYKLPNYFYVRDLSPQGLYHALKQSPLAIGVRDWMGVGPHFMTAYDVTEDGQALECVNWWKEQEQDKAIVPFKDVVIAVAFLPLPDNVDKKQARLPFYEVLGDKLSFLLKKYVY